MINKGDVDLLEDALAELVDWIDNLYNTKRRHSSLGYLGPAEFERRHRQAIRLAADGLKPVYVQRQKRWYKRWFGS